MKRLWPVLAVVSVLAGCVTMPTPTYLPDGRQGYVIECPGTAYSWGHCYQRAGEVCGARGYEILAQTGDQGAVFGTSVITRSLVIACKG